MSRKGVCHYGPTNTFVVSSPISDISIVSCPIGLHSITLKNDISDDNFRPDPRCQVQLISQVFEDNGHKYQPALQCVNWLQDFFSKETNKTVPAICPSVFSGRTFASKVWLKLIEVARFGTTLSYKQLSEASGNVKAVRAVGQAMARNPLLLVVPCHRVIRSDGSLGNYSSGRRNSVKQWLILFEKGNSSG